MIEASCKHKSIVYISGRGGNFTFGLGEYLASKTEQLDGLSLSNEFLRRDFQIQLDVVSKLVLKAKDSTLVANSYGAYLLMHVLLSRRVELSNLILISPILGSCYSANRFFKPPFSQHLNTLMSKTGNHLPEKTTIIWGAEDESIDQNGLKKLTSQCTDIQLIEIDAQKHHIDKQILAKTLDRILS